MLHRRSLVFLLYLCLSLILESKTLDLVRSNNSRPWGLLKRTGAGRGHWDPGHWNVSDSPWESKSDCPECVEGECISPNQCDCSVNFGGLHCNEICQLGHFGTNCERNCDCILDRKCNKNYSNCLCKSSSVSSGCRDICKCRNLCAPGWIGKDCGQRCPKNSYGRLCSQNCTCSTENTKGCNPEDGFCVCKDRFYGLNCESYCEEPWSLICLNNSTQECKCENELDKLSPAEREVAIEKFRHIMDKTWKEFQKKQIEEIESRQVIILVVSVILFTLGVFISLCWCFAASCEYLINRPRN